MRTARRSDGAKISSRETARRRKTIFATAGCVQHGRHGEDARGGRDPRGRPIRTRSRKWPWRRPGDETGSAPGDSALLHAILAGAVLRPRPLALRWRPPWTGGRPKRLGRRTSPCGLRHTVWATPWDRLAGDAGADPAAGADDEAASAAEADGQATDPIRAHGTTGYQGEGRDSRREPAWRGIVLTLRLANRGTLVPLRGVIRRCHGRHRHDWAMRCVCNLDNAAGLLQIAVPGE